MDCTHISEILPWFVAGTLDEGERRAVEEHLEGCEDCRRELDDTRFAGEVFRQHLPAEVLVDLGFGRPVADFDATVAEEHLAICPQCSVELELVRESAWRSAHDEARVVPFAAGRRETRPRRGIAPRWSRMALAAGVAGIAAAAGMGWELYSVSRKLAEPMLNVRVADAYPLDAVSRDRPRPVTVEIPAEAETLTLLLQAPAAEEFPGYELEMVDASGEVLFVGEGLQRQPEGDFTVSLRTRGLPGELTLRLIGVHGEVRREIARYVLAPKPAGVE